MIVMVGLVVLAVYLPTLLAGRSLVEDPGINDVSANWMTNYSWVGQAYREGVFPLWNPHILCGMPHLSYTHCGGLYLPQILFFSLLPYVWAGSLTIVFHSLLCAILLYLLVRQYGVGPRLAAVASLVAVLSGSFFGMLNYTPNLGTIAGLLLAWICLRRAFPKPRLLDLLGGALGLAWGAIAGEPELLTYSLIGLYLVLILEAEAGWRERLKRSLLIFLVTVGALVIIAALLLPTLETVHFSIRGPLLPFHLDFPRLGESRWPTLLTWLSPFRYYYQMYPSIAMNYGLSPLYQGFLMPGLILWGLAGAVRNRQFRALAAGWILLLLWGLLREGTTTGPLFDWIPILGALQFGGKALIMVHLLGVVLAFRALAQAEQASAEKKSALILGILLLASGAMLSISQPWSSGGKERVALGLLAAALGAAVMIRRGGKGLLSVRSAVAAGVLLWGSEIVILNWQYHPRTDPARYRLAPAVESFAHSLPAETRYAIFEPIQSDDPRSLHPLFGLFELASGAGNLLGSPRLPPARIFLYVNQIFPNLITQTPSGQKIFTNLQGKNPWPLDHSRMHLFHLAGAREILSQDLPLSEASPYSLLRPAAAPWQILGPSGPAEQRLESDWIPAPFQAKTLLSGLPGDRLLLEYQIEAQPAGGWLDLAAAFPDSASNRLLLSRYLGAGGRGEHRIGLEPLARPEGRLLLTWLPNAAKPGRLKLDRLEILNPGRPFQRQAKWGAVEAFQNQDALPRALIVHQAAVFHDWDTLLETLRDSTRFLPSQEVILEASDREVEVVQRGAGLGGAAGPGEGAKIVRYGSQEVEMIARLNRPGFLVFSDTFFPGWRAYVEDRGTWQEVKVRPADLAFRAVFLLDGIHRLRFVYQPLSFRLGLWASLASLASVLALVLTRGKRRSVNMGPDPKLT